jgi:hypothetical protein
MLIQPHAQPHPNVFQIHKNSQQISDTRKGRKKSFECLFWFEDGQMLRTDDSLIINPHVQQQLFVWLHDPYV